MPRPMAEAPGVSARLRDGRLLVSGPATIADTVWFYPDDTPGVRPRTPGPVPGRVFGGRYMLDIPLRIEPENALDGPLQAAGLVVLMRRGSTRILGSVSIVLSVPTGEASSPTTEP